MRITGLKLQLKPERRDRGHTTTAPALSGLAGQVGNRGMLQLARSREGDVVPATGGRPLPAAERAFFESRYSASLDGVRLHTDPDAAKLAQAHGAAAYTYGRDIVFAAGQYRPETHEGRHLLAHELAHVVQGGRDQLRRSPDERIAISQPHDEAEREADRAADHALDPARGGVAIQPRSGPPLIRRVIPNPGSKERRENKPYIDLYRARISMYRLKLALLARHGITTADLGPALDAAATYLDAYEKGYGIKGGITPILGLAGPFPAAPVTPIISPILPPIVTPSVTPVTPVTPTVTPIVTPTQATGTPTGAGAMNLLGVGVAIGLGVTSLIWNATTSSDVAPVKFSDVTRTMEDLTKLFAPINAQFDELVKQLKTPQPQLQPQPVVTEQPAPVTTTKKDPDPPASCPAGTMPYSQDAAVSRVTSLIRGAPLRIGDAGRATSWGQANFLATIKSNAAVISVVTKENCTLAQVEGTHDVGDTLHAEEVALTRLIAWRATRPAIPVGSRLSVVVSASPCGEDRHNCWRQLGSFARTTAPILAYDPSKARYLLTVSGIRPRK